MVNNTKNYLQHTYWSIFYTSVLSLSCGGGDDGISRPIGSDPDPVTITVDIGTTYQAIAGFGGANRVFGGSFPNNGDMQKAFGADEGELGLTIFRVRVPPNQNEWAAIAGVAAEAQKYGAKIIASPWSPPAQLKSNGSTIGGYLPEENYLAFVEHLNAYIDFMSSNGVDIYAISIQNEPDIEVTYESCDWTASAMVDFIENYGQLIEGAQVAAPESFNFSQGFTNALLTDEEAVENLDIVAGHIYGGGLAPLPLAEEKGKEVWMTEYLMNLDVGDWAGTDENTKWEETLKMLNTVHKAMEYNWNAYVWWYLKRYYSFIGEGAEGTTDGEILKRGYAFSQFSKYIRPGYVRVGVDEESTTGLDITAYTGDNQVVVVLINQGSNPVNNLNLTVFNTTPTAAKSYTTALNLDRQMRDLELAEDGHVTVNMSPKSIATVAFKL